MTTPYMKLNVAEMQRAMAPARGYVPPEDCFVKYGEAVLRVRQASSVYGELPKNITEKTFNTKP